MRGIIIKIINDATTRMATKLMACKLLRKCRKEEVPAGVVAAAVQCQWHHAQLGPLPIKHVPR
jgi:hypothetical protein